MSSPLATEAYRMLPTQFKLLVRAVGELTEATPQEFEMQIAKLFTTYHAIK